MNETQHLSRLPLAGLPYHRALPEFLRKSDPDLWRWFSQTHRSERALEDLRFELLKSTYRVDRESQPGLYETAEEVVRQLGVDAPLTIYQAQNPEGLNASLAFAPGEIHVVLHGPVSKRLSALELRGLFAHEIAHYVLYQREQGELLIAEDMLWALVNDVRSHPAYFASLRLLRLYGEIYCDRAAYAVTQDLHAMVAMLVKIKTNLEEINAESYLRQADEIFARDNATTSGITHPEGYIRARALRLWAESVENSDELIAAMIEGDPGMDDLDLLAQEKMALATRTAIDAMLAHKWMRTDVVLGHARLFFEDYAPPDAVLAKTNDQKLARSGPDSIRDYLCYVLLDFVTADRDLEAAPLAAALAIADDWGIKPRLMELARKELRMRKNQIEQVDRKRQELIAEAERTLSVPP